MPSKSAMERFEAKVSPEPNSGCWLWAACADKNGYGQMRLDGRRGRLVYAHRFAFEAYVGRVPDGAFVLHKCDNPACANPDHLFLGTQADNMRDKAAKGRGTAPPLHVGDRHPRSKLTAAEVIAIRAAPGTLKEIAEKFGIHFSQVSNIKRGKQWVALEAV